MICGEFESKFAKMGKKIFPVKQQKHFTYCCDYCRSEKYSGRDRPFVRFAVL